MLFPFWCISDSLHLPPFPPPRSRDLDLVMTETLSREWAASLLGNLSGIPVKTATPMGSFSEGRKFLGVSAVFREAYIARNFEWWKRVLQQKSIANVSALLLVEKRKWSALDTFPPFVSKAGNGMVTIRHLSIGQWALISPTYDSIWKRKQPWSLVENAFVYIWAATMTLEYAKSRDVFGVCVFCS
jgi:hypothetical protein